MTYEKIQIAKADGLATLTLNVPDRLNAVSRKMITELKHCWEDLAADASVRPAKSMLAAAISVLAPCSSRAP